MTDYTRMVMFNAPPAMILNAFVEQGMPFETHAASTDGADKPAHQQPVQPDQASQMSTRRPRFSFGFSA